MPTPDDLPFPTASSATPPGEGLGGNGREAIEAAAGAARGGAAGSSGAFERVVEGAHRTVDRLAETAGGLREGIDADAAAGSLNDRLDEFRALGDEWADSLRSTVREHPLAALAAAVAVGVIIARASSSTR